MRQADRSLQDAVGSPQAVERLGAQRVPRLDEVLGPAGFRHPLQGDALRTGDGLKDPHRALDQFGTDAVTEDDGDPYANFAADAPAIFPNTEPLVRPLPPG